MLSLKNFRKKKIASFKNSVPCFQQTKWYGIFKGRYIIYGCIKHICIPIALLTTVAGCGRVVTVTPTPEPQPTATFVLALPTVETTATPLPANFTPAPTATPTKVPTPIVYTIETGDSLLTVAQLYNVSVNALQEANGILDPRTLQIGQEVVIPQQIEEEDAFATATPTPMPATVENISFGENSIGGLWVMGEVFNSSSVPLEQIRVSFVLLDEADEMLAETSDLAALDIVNTDESAPFSMLIDNAPRNFTQYRVDLLSAVPAYIGGYYRDLEIRDLQSRGDGTEPYTVSGRIYNFGTVEAVNVQVILTAYDIDGRVVAVRKIFPTDAVVPKLGETSFNIIIAPQGGAVANVSAVAIGRRFQ